MSTTPIDELTRVLHEHRRFAGTAHERAYFRELTDMLCEQLFDRSTYAGQHGLSLFAEALVPAHSTMRVALVRTVIASLSEHGPHGAAAYLDRHATDALSRGKDLLAASMFNLARALEHAQPSDEVLDWQRRHWSGEGVGWSSGSTATRSSGTARAERLSSAARPRRRVRRI